MANQAEESKIETVPIQTVYELIDEAFDIYLQHDLATSYEQVLEFIGPFNPDNQAVILWACLH